MNMNAETKIVHQRLRRAAQQLNEADRERRSPLSRHFRSLPAAYLKR